MRRHLFGDHLRQAREAAGFRLGEFARMLGVSTPYLSDVELGNRQPFSGEKLSRVAELLPAATLSHFKVLAAETRGAFALEPVTEDHQRAGRALMRRWAELDPDKLGQIIKIVEDDEDEEAGSR